VLVSVAAIRALTPSRERSEHFGLLQYVEDDSE
jgi:hypothetical protein